MNDTFEFNSLNDWGRVDAELRRSLRALHDFGSKKQLAKMLDNLQHAVTELSKSEIDYRRTMNSTIYLAKLATVREQLHHLQQWLMFATLIDTKPEE
jgi:hypothetical protein